MVAFYKHDIAAWMDGTESLSDRAYRAYHVIVQLIYLNEGPIALNEHGIAGRCKQSIRTFRASLQELLDAGKLAILDGRLTNSRADKELEKIDVNRLNAGKGGMNAHKQRSHTGKPLKSLDVDQAPLERPPSLIDKTRLEERREEINTSPAAPNIEAEFSEFYAAYPKHVGRPHALKAYRRVRKKLSAQQLLEIAKAAAVRFAGTDHQFIPQPSTFLNGERWLDEEPNGLRVASTPEDANYRGLL